MIGARAHLLHDQRYHAVGSRPAGGDARRVKPMRPHDLAQ